MWTEFIGIKTRCLESTLKEVAQETIEMLGLRNLCLGVFLAPFNNHAFSKQSPRAASLINLMWLVCTIPFFHDLLQPAATINVICRTTMESFSSTANKNHFSISKEGTVSTVAIAKNKRQTKIYIYIYIITWSKRWTCLTTQHAVLQLRGIDLLPHIYMVDFRVVVLRWQDTIRG